MLQSDIIYIYSEEQSVDRTFVYTRMLSCRSSVTEIRDYAIWIDECNYKDGIVFARSYQYLSLLTRNYISNTYSRSTMTDQRTRVILASAIKYFLINRAKQFGGFIVCE